MDRSKNESKITTSAFTIVELLVVVAVIAILAAITIVAYGNVTSNARKSALVTNLDQANKALNVYKEMDSSSGFYPSNLSAARVDLSGTNYNYYVSDDGSNYCLQGTTDGVIKSIAGNSQIVSDSTCIVTTNLITNGDFSQGTTGWWGLNSASIVATSNSLKIIGSPTITSKRAAQSTLSLVAAHKYYGKASMLADSSMALSTSYFVASNDFSYQLVGPSSSLAQGAWTTISNILSPTSTCTIIGLGASFSTVTDAATTTVWIDNAILIDLTTAFGAGKEPTAAQMDAILAHFPNSWFNGKNVVQAPIN